MASLQGEERIYDVHHLDAIPQFQGGQEKFFKFLEENIKYPRHHVGGKVYAQFIVEKDGTLSDLKI